jgi:hypothetical protein
LKVKVSRGIGDYDRLHSKIRLVLFRESLAHGEHRSCFWDVLPTEVNVEGLEKGSPDPVVLEVARRILVRIEDNFGSRLPLKGKRQCVDVVGDDHIILVVQLLPQISVIVKDPVCKPVGAQGQGQREPTFPDQRKSGLPDADKSDTRRFFRVKAYNGDGILFSQPIDLTFNPCIVPEIAEDENKNVLHGGKSTRYF